MGALPSSVHRSILGGLLAVAGIIGLGWVIRAVRGEGRLLFAGIGVAVTGIAACWICYLFVDGLRERD